MIHDLLSAIERAQPQYYRLVLLVGGPGSTKTTLLTHLSEKHGYPCLRLSLAISEQMLGMNSRQRSAEVDGLVKQLVGDAGGAVVLLDNIEVLFEPTLQVDPLRVLLGASRNTVVVAAWTGTYDGKTFTYAKAGHPEHRVYRDPEAIIVTAK